MKKIIIAWVVVFVIPLTLKAQEKTKDMKTAMEQAKLSCKLTTPELQQHKKTVIAELKNQVREKVETDSGYKYKFEGSDKMLDLLNSFIKTERLCCDFFVFTSLHQAIQNLHGLNCRGQKEQRILSNMRLIFNAHF